RRAWSSRRRASWTSAPPSTCLPPRPHRRRCGRGWPPAWPTPSRCRPLSRGRSRTAGARRTRRIPCGRCRLGRCRRSRCCSSLTPHSSDWSILRSGCLSWSWAAPTGAVLLSDLAADLRRQLDRSAMRLTTALVLAGLPDEHGRPVADVLGHVERLLSGDAVVDEDAALTRTLEPRLG